MTNDNQPISKNFSSVCGQPYLENGILVKFYFYSPIDIYFLRRWFLPVVD
ncbi:MAG: hypothetical protein ACI823_002638 [Chitinophagales bacterium]